MTPLSQSSLWPWIWTRQCLQHSLTRVHVIYGRYPVSSQSNPSTPTRMQLLVAELIRIRLLEVRKQMNGSFRRFKRDKFGHELSDSFFPQNFCASWQIRGAGVFCAPFPSNLVFIGAKTLFLVIDQRDDPLGDQGSKIPQRVVCVPPPTKVSSA